MELVGGDDAAALECHRHPVHPGCEPRLLPVHGCTLARSALRRPSSSVRPVAAFSAFLFFRDSPQRRRRAARGAGLGGAVLPLRPRPAARAGGRGAATTSRSGARRASATRRAERLLNGVVYGVGGHGGDFASVLARRGAAGAADVVFSTVDTVGLPLVLLAARRARAAPARLRCDRAAGAARRPPRRESAPPLRRRAPHGGHDRRLQPVRGRADRGLDRRMRSAAPCGVRAVRRRHELLPTRAGANCGRRRRSRSAPTRAATSRSSSRSPRTGRNGRCGS